MKLYLITIDDHYIPAYFVVADDIGYVYETLKRFGHAEKVNSIKHVSDRVLAIEEAPHE